MNIAVVVHPIDTAAHPGIPAGWRWAVMVGGAPPDDLSHCANAGWCPTAREAEAEGDQNAATATKVARLLGLPVTYSGVTHLTVDPVPAGGDLIAIGG